MSEMLKLPLPASDDPDSITVALASIRKHLGMPVAYVSEFVDGRAVFREVDAPGLEAMIKVGDSQSLDDVYCRHILEGRLPELMANTADHPMAMALPMTAAAPIGSHMSVPIRMPDGDVYGMFCCLSPDPDASLNARDLAVMHVFADMAAAQMAHRRGAERGLMAARSRVQAVIDTSDFRIVLQPIWQFGQDRPSGFEALTRFPSLPQRTPDLWFNEAASIGLGEDLELAAVASALESLASLPDDVYLSVNLAPPTLVGERLAGMLSAYPMHRIVLELTEHRVVDDYPAVAAALAPLRKAGARLAVDDAGAGYANFQHILRLEPDIIKLDMALTRHVDTDLSRRALTSAMVRFAADTRSIVVAEGVETEGERLALQALGVGYGQGFLLGKPDDLAAALRLASAGDSPAADY